MRDDLKDWFRRGRGGKMTFFLDDVVLVVALVSVLQEGENKSVQRNPPNGFCKALRWDDTFFCEDNVPWS